MLKKQNRQQGRASLFQSRHGSHSGHGDKSKVFQKRPFGARVPQDQDSAPVKVDRATVVRRQALKRLIADAKGGVERIAMICELTDARVNRLQEGQDMLDSQVAMHLEEMLGLPQGWMEKDAPIPEETLAAIQAENWIPPTDDFHDEIFGLEVSESPSPASASEDDDIWVDEALGDGSESPIHVEEPKAPKAAKTTNKAASSAASVSTPYLDSQIKLMQVADVFPNLRQYLHQKTGRSLPTISGAVTGKRPLTKKNTAEFEAALGQPSGWLSQESSEEVLISDLRRGVGDALDVPKPRRGRKSFAEKRAAEAAQQEATKATPRARPKAAPVQVAAKPELPAKREERASAPEAKEFIKAEPFSPAQAGPQEAAQDHTTPAATNDILLLAVTEKIKELRAQNKVTDRKMSQILSVLFE